MKFKKLIVLFCLLSLFCCEGPQETQNDIVRDYSQFRMLDQDLLCKFGVVGIRSDSGYERLFYELVVSKPISEYSYTEVYRFNFPNDLIDWSISKDLEGVIEIVDQNEFRIIFKSGYQRFYFSKIEGGLTQVTTARFYEP